MVLLSAFTLVSCKGNASGYTIKGSIETDMFSLDSIYLYEASTPIVSAAVKDGKFEIKGKVEEPKKMILGDMESGFGVDIILENTDYTLVVNDNEITLKGGNLHEKVLGYTNDEAYNKAINEYMDAEDAFFELNDESDKEKYAAAEAIVNKKGQAVVKIQNDHFRKLLEGNESTLVKLFALNQSEDWEAYPIEKRLELLDVFEKELGALPLLTRYREYLINDQEMSAAAKNVAIGKPYINVVAQTRDKQTVELANVIAANKYTMLDFWASWCGPCRAETPNLEKAYEKYKAKGFEIYAISLDEKEADWLKALDEENTPWINVYNAGGYGGEVVKSYGIQGIPSSFLIDKDGNIVASMDQLRGEELDITLQNLLK